MKFWSFDYARASESVESNSFAGAASSRTISIRNANELPKIDRISEKKSCVCHEYYRQEHRSPNRRNQKNANQSAWNSFRKTQLT